MATITSQATGNWSAGGTWVGGVVPGDNDNAVIAAAHTVTLDVADQCLSLTVNGSFVQNAHLTFTDASGCGLTITTTGNYTSNGSTSTPRLIKSASAAPTYPWDMLVHDVVGADSRSLNFNYVEFQGNEFFLGNETYYQNFNGNQTYDPLITHVTPTGRSPRLSEHEIFGRSTGRVYHRSIGAKSVTINGVVRKEAQLRVAIESIITSKQRISLFTRFYHLPKCRIEREPQYRDRGGLYEEFTISVREDV